MPAHRSSPLAREVHSESPNAGIGLPSASNRLRTAMNRPLWKQALIPTLLLGGLWLAFSLATTGYIAWLDRGYRRLLNENVATMRATGEMQGILWSLHDTIADASESELIRAETDRIGIETQRLRAALQSADLAARTDEERREVDRLRRSFDDYVGLLRNTDRGAPLAPEDISQIRARSRELAVSMSAGCNHLREINQRLIKANTSQRETWNSRIGGTRIVLLFIGPILGVWLGVRAASRVRRRLAEISVRLEGASGELGRLEVSSNPGAGNFDELDRQVLAITQRLDDALQQLHSARHEILRRERLAAVGQLAAGVAHELRNPLTAVKLLVQTVARSQEDNGTTAKQLGVVKDEIVRMERTIQSLLDYARPPAQNRLRHDLRETLGRALNLVESRAAHDCVGIELLLPNEPLELDGDPEQLHQVFVNLLLNGMDAMPNGGEISVKLEHDQPASHDDNSAAPTCVVTVEDRGSGIPATVIERLFEPFVTTKERGTGLGLAVSRRIIEEHSGTLTGTNGPQGGAIFSVRLPVTARNAPVERAAQVSRKV